MLILAVDTTTRAGSLALVADGAVRAELRGDASRTHAQRLPDDIRRLCDAAGVGIREVDMYAVAAGPGSFTGLRIGIAAVQGLAMAWGRRVVPVSSLEALALGGPPGPSRVAAWMDAQRGQVFAQVFDVDQGRTTARPLTPAVALPPADAIDTHRALVGDAQFVGDGATRYRDVIAGVLGERSRVAPEVPALAAAIGLIAWREPGRAVLPHAVVPIYVRRPDAELARDRSISR